MAELRSLPKFDGYLDIFVGDLRSHVFRYQKDAASYFHLHHSTLSRYENGEPTPTLGYLAGLAKLFVEQQASKEASDCRQALLCEVHKAIRRCDCYVHESPFEDWGELCAKADEYIDKRPTPIFPHALPRPDEPSASGWPPNSPAPPEPPKHPAVEMTNRDNVFCVVDG